MLQKDVVRVSEIVACLTCPRKLYFSLHSNENNDGKKSKAYITHLLLRELALSFSSILENEGSLLEALEKALDIAGEEISLIYRNELNNVDEALITQAKSEAGAQLPVIASGLKASIDRYGRERFLQLINPWKLEQEMTLQKQMLVGRLDRIVCLESEIIPSMIKTGSPPDYGVWLSDRVQLAAYSILVEANYGAVINRGFVEYARIGTLREVTIKRHDRRRVLRLRDEVLRIKKGSMPGRTDSSECSYCAYRARCETKVSLASKFFENIL